MPRASSSIDLEHYDTFLHEAPSQRSTTGSLHIIGAMLSTVLFTAAGLGAFNFGRQLYVSTYGSRSVMTSAPNVAPMFAARQPEQAPLRASTSEFMPSIAKEDHKLRGAPQPAQNTNPIASFLKKASGNKLLSSFVVSAVGLATMCMMFPDVANAEAAIPFMSPDVFHGLAHSATQTMADAQQVAANMDATPATSQLVDVVGNAAQQMAQRAQELARVAEGGEVVEAAKTGWFDSLVNFVKESIINIEGALDDIGVAQSAGLAITLFTLLVKGVTFPLNYQQMESTSKMQVLQPTVKSIQDRFKANPQEGNVEIARLYKRYKINPLAALLPIFVQIPIFIALYRALRELAEQNLLDQPFLFLPSLEGPIFDAQAGHTTEWLTSGTLPPSEVAAYLAIPVLLVASQYVSTALQKVPGQETPAWVNYLPLMTGAFALNVPSGLSLYWIINNFVTTGTTLAIKQYVKSSDDVKTMEQELAEMAKSPNRNVGPAPYGGPQLSRRERRALGLANDVLNADATVTDAAEATPKAATEADQTVAATATTAPRGGKSKGGKKKKR